METNTPRGGAATPDRPATPPETPAVEPSAPPAQAPQRYPVPTYEPPTTPPGMAPHYPPYPTPYPPAPYPPTYGYPPARRGGNARRGWLIGGIIAFGALVLVLALVVGMIVFALNVAGPTYSSSATRTFAVTGTPIVSVYDTAGTVTVRQGNVGQVVVQVTKHVRSLDSNGAQRALDATAITTSQSGNAITVDGHFTTRWQDGVWYNRTVDMTLTVPATTNATVHVAAGSIDVANISGALNVETNAGTVTARDVTLADGSSVTTNAGTISLTGAIAPNADVRVVDNAGSVTLRLPTATPARLDASVSVGSISISGWPITVSRQNTVGASAAGNLGSDPSGTLHVSISAGNLSLIAQ